MPVQGASTAVPPAGHLAHHGRFALGGVGGAFVEATAVTPEGRITPGCTRPLERQPARPLRRHRRALPLAEDPGRHPARACRAQRQRGRAAGRRGAAARPPIRRGLAGRCAELRCDRGRLADAARAANGGYRSAGRAFAAAARAPAAPASTSSRFTARTAICIHSFLSPLANQRNDGYGGILRERMRFPLGSQSAVRAAVPDRCRVFYRTSAVDGTTAGWTIEDTIALARELKALRSRRDRLLVRRHRRSSGARWRPSPAITSRTRRVRRGADRTMAVGLILTGAGRRHRRRGQRRSRRARPPADRRPEFRLSRGVRAESPASARCATRLLRVFPGTPPPELTEFIAQDFPCSAASYA